MQKSSAQEWNEASFLRVLNSLLERIHSCFGKSKQISKLSYFYLVYSAFHQKAKLHMPVEHKPCLEKFRIEIPLIQ